jgi:outer membrane protein with beta-barrel domain
MRKIFTIFLIAYPITLYSQNSFSIGALGGVNANFYMGAALIDSKKGFGPVAGAFIESMGPQKWGFLGRVLYDDKRGTFTSQDTNAQGEWQNNENKISLSYLSIDAFFEYRFKVGVSFHAGPTVAFPIHGTTEKTTTPLTTNILDTGVTSNDSSITVKEDVTGLSRRMGVKVGIGLDIMLSKKLGLLIQSSLDWGFSKVKEDFSWRIRSWQTVIGLKYSLH